MLPGILPSCVRTETGTVPFVRWLLGSCCSDSTRGDRPRSLEASKPRPQPGEARRGEMRRDLNLQEVLEHRTTGRRRLYGTGNIREAIRGQTMAWARRVSSLGDALCTSPDGQGHKGTACLFLPRLCISTVQYLKKTGASINEGTTGMTKPL